MNYAQAMQISKKGITSVGEIVAKDRFISGPDWYFKRRPLKAKKTVCESVCVYFWRGGLSKQHIEVVIAGEPVR